MNAVVDSTALGHECQLDSTDHNRRGPCCTKDRIPDCESYSRAKNAETDPDYQEGLPRGTAAGISRVQLVSARWTTHGRVRN